jgi:hypothetical protein
MQDTTKRKAAKKLAPVKKPYLTGSIVDKTTLGGAVKMFFFSVFMCVAFLLITFITNWNSLFLNVATGLLILMGTYLIFFQSGLKLGADAVNQGEIMYQRQEKGRPVADWERRLCYHPLKGFVHALIGFLPLVIITAVYACMAQIEKTGIGVPAAWTQQFMDNPDIAPPLQQIYYQEHELTAAVILRPISRASMIPYLKLFDLGYSKPGKLLLDHLAPILNLLPAIVYGVGYAFGTKIRTAVHTNIALGKKKAKRKQAKERRARRTQTHRGPEQLN